jgi:predicted RNase H-like HicB family nuclease
MKNEFTAIIEHGENGWWVASCPEIPAANGQGRTPEAAREDLAAAVALVLEYLRDKALKSAPPGARQDTIAVG